jgi:site-specific recombinase XerD
VQELLGHESILTTEVYTHVNRKQLRGVVEESFANVDNLIIESYEDN